MLRLDGPPRLYLPAAIECTYSDGDWGVDGGLERPQIITSQDVEVLADGTLQGCRFTETGLRLLSRRLPGNFYSYLRSLRLFEPSASAETHGLSVSMLRQLLRQSLHGLLGQRWIVRPRLFLITGVTESLHLFDSWTVGQTASRYCRQYGFQLLEAAASDNSFYLAFESPAMRRCLAPRSVLSPLLVFRATGELGARLEACAGLNVHDRGVCLLRPIGSVRHQSVSSPQDSILQLLSRIDKKWQTKLLALLDEATAVAGALDVPVPPEPEIRQRLAYRAKRAAMAFTDCVLSRRPVAASGFDFLVNFSRWISRQTSAARRLHAADVATSFFDSCRY